MKLYEGNNERSEVMKERINYPGTNFYLSLIPICIEGLHEIEIPRSTKKMLRYQRLFLVHRREKKFTVLDISGKTLISISPDYTNAYVLMKQETLFPETTEKLDPWEIWLTKVLVSYFSETKPEITEKLCAILGNSYLEKYHKVYGRDGLVSFGKSIFDMPVKDELLVTQSNYSRPRYSILSLSRDLQRIPDLEIYTDPELIGKYKRITRKTDSGSKALLDRWAKLLGIQGNRTRANLSVRVKSKVEVQIPENEFGIESGPCEVEAIRSFAFVCDGVLNMEELGIRTRDRKFLGKLKRLGIIEPMLFDSEYVINLTKLPMYSKSRPLSSYRLGKSEYLVAESKVLCTYLDQLLYRHQAGLKKLPMKKHVETREKTDAEKFLESLGIYDGTYYPDHTKSGPTVSSYYTTEVIGRVSGFPSDPYVSVRDFINLGTCKYPAIQNILTPYKYLLVEKDIKVLESVRDELEEERKARLTELRGLKFKLILDKTLRFSDHHQPRVETKVVTVTGDAKVSWNVRDSVIEI